MPVWPLPDQSERVLPEPGGPGSFRRNRGDRFHCGVDLYAPAGSRVAAIEAGEVIETDLFTTPERRPYWNVTRYVTVRHDSGKAVRYAELDEVRVRPGERVEEGTILGAVGAVLNPGRIDDKAPAYVRELARRGRVSMLHLELYAAPPRPDDAYLAGNITAPARPEGLLDPTPLLRSALGEE